MLIAVQNQDGAMALTGGQEKNLPNSFTLSGQLAGEIRALTRYHGTKTRLLIPCLYHCRCRHRNLVDLMGYCLYPPTLIYEYMEQGNLHDKLFNKVQFICMKL